MLLTRFSFFVTVWVANLSTLFFSNAKGSGELFLASNNRVSLGLKLNLLIQS